MLLKSCAFSSACALPPETRAAFHYVSLNVVVDPTAPVRVPTLSVLAGLQHSITSLADCILALPSRLGVSHGVLGFETLELAQRISAAARDAAFDCGVLTTQWGKALVCAAEEARVRAEQLEAYATLMEREASDGEGDSGVATVARALLSLQHSAGAPSFLATGITWDTNHC